MRRITEKIMGPKLALCAALGFIHSVLLYWPGFHSFDSLDRLRQARLDLINDHYPLLVALLSQWVDGVIPVSVFFLVLQLSLMSLGIYLLVRSLPGLSDFTRCSVLLLIQLFPPTTTAFAYISLDALMAASMMFGFGLLSSNFPALSDRSADSMSLRRIGSVLAILSGFGLAIAVRHNGFMAAFVGVWCLVHLFRKKVGRPRLTTNGIIALSTTLILTGFAIFTPRIFIDVEHFNMTGMIAMHDIAGMVVAKGNLTADEVKRLSEAEIADRRLTFEDFAAHHSPRSSVPFWTQARLNKENRAHPEVFSLWRKMIRDHPMAYLKHRSQVFYEIMFDPRIDHRLQHSRHVPEYFNGDNMPTARKSRYQTHYVMLVDAVRPLTSPAIYFFLGIVSIPLLLLASKRRNIVIVCLAMSGIGYQLGFFFVGSSAMNRFSIWMNLSGLAAFAIAIAQLHTRRKDNPI